MRENKRKRADFILPVAAIAVLLLAMLTISEVRQLSDTPAGFEKFDVERVKTDIDRGALSGKESQYWEEVR